MVARAAAGAAAPQEEEGDAEWVEEERVCCSTRHAKVEDAEKQEEYEEEDRSCCCRHRKGNDTKYCGSNSICYCPAWPQAEDLCVWCPSPFKRLFFKVACFPCQLACSLVASVMKWARNYAAYQLMGFACGLLGAIVLLLWVWAVGVGEIATSVVAGGSKVGADIGGQLYLVATGNRTFT